MNKNLEFSFSFGHSLERMRRVEQILSTEAIHFEKLESILLCLLVQLTYDGVHYDEPEISANVLEQMSVGDYNKLTEACTIFIKAYCSMILKVLPSANH